MIRAWFGLTSIQVPLFYAEVYFETEFSYILSSMYNILVFTLSERSFWYHV